MKNYLKLFILGLFIYFLVGCSKQTLEKDTMLVKDSGLTYEFQLPSGWKEDPSPVSLSERNAALRTIDMNSKSFMYVLVFPKNAVEEKDFGTRTRQELAIQQNYSDPKKIYMKEYEIDGNKAYKYTFETKVKQRRFWAHYYAVFTKNGIIQFQFFSADDRDYKERSKVINQSVKTVKEKGVDKNYDSEKEVKKNEGDKIEVANEQMKVTLSGALTLSGENKTTLYAIRFQMTNLSEEPILPKVLQKLCIVTQNDQPLKEAAVPENSTLYQVKEAAANNEKELLPKQTVEGVLIYQLIDKSGLSLAFSKESFGEQSTFSLLIP